MAAPGRIFGLRALVTENLPEIEAICRTECELRLFRQIFMSALKSHPQMYLPVARLLSADLKLAQTYLKARARRKLARRGFKLCASDRTVTPVTASSHATCEYRLQTDGRAGRGAALVTANQSRAAL